MSETNVWAIAVAPRTSDGPADEPSHIHIPRPSRLRRLEDAAASATSTGGLTRLTAHQVQPALEDAA